MLVCPQCQFENPDNNKFCQKCGCSLIDKACPSCSSRVRFDALQCQNCGENTGLLWWAIVSESPSQIPVPDMVSAQDFKATPPDTTPASISGQSPTISLSEASADHIDPGGDLHNLASGQEITPQSPESESFSTRSLESDLDNEIDVSGDIEYLDESDFESPADVSSAAASDLSQPEPVAESTKQTAEVSDPLSMAANKPPLTQESDKSAASNLQNPSQPLTATPEIPAIGGTTTEPFLDFDQRYQILESISTPPVPSSYAPAVDRFQVLDCQPLKKSALSILLDNQAKASNLDDLDSDALAAMIPEVAQPYMALQSQLYHVIPVVHDAWEQDGKIILLLEDRSRLPKLIDRWCDPDIPPLQLLHWLYEMAELWSELHPWFCCQSLIEVENLRIDEDQALCLQCLYDDKINQPPTLLHLGQVWQTLFQQSRRKIFGSLFQLIQDLQKGSVSNIVDVRSRVEAIAYDLQANLPPAAMREDDMSSPDTHDRLNLSSMPEEADTIPERDPSETSGEASPSAQTDRETATASPVGTTTHFQIPVSGDEDSSNGGDDTPTVVLPMRLVSLEDAGRTDVGRQRSHNEDYFGIETEISKLESPSGQTVNARGLFILCDGMGGHAGGEVASALATKTVKQYFREHWKEEFPGEESIRESIRLANQAIYDVNQEDARSGIGRMGTTLVMVLVQNTKVAIAHVGDSRLYRLSRKRGLSQVTVDHEVGQREIQRGVEPSIAYGRPDAYQLTQALGPRDEYFVNPDVQFLELNEDTLLILCSDGMSDNDLLETHWQANVAPLLSSRTNLDQGVSQLIDLANQHNGHDNITVLAIRAKVRPDMEQH